MTTANLSAIDLQSFLNTLQQINPDLTISDILKIVTPQTDTVQPTSVLVAKSEPAELQPFIEFLTSELSQYFSSTDAKLIVATLDKIRQQSFSDYRDFCYIYQQITFSEVEKRQLLLTVSAVWRYKFGSGTSKYQLRSIIKYASACPHCGAFASKMMDRLKVEKLWA
jgi:hypothetical protein